MFSGVCFSADPLEDQVEITNSHASHQHVKAPAGISINCPTSPTGGSLVPLSLILVYAFSSLQGFWPPSP